MKLKSSFILILVFIFCTSCKKNENRFIESYFVYLFLRKPANPINTQLTDRQQQATILAYSALASYNASAPSVGILPTGISPGGTNLPPPQGSILNFNHKKILYNYNIKSVSSSQTGNTTTSGTKISKSYSLTGDLDGYGAKITRVDFGAINSSLASCIFQYFTQTTSKSGKINLNSGQLNYTYDTTNTSSTSVNNGDMTLDLSVSSYSNFWFDEYSYWKKIQSYQNQNSSISSTSPTCLDYKSFYALYLSYWNFSIVTGDIQSKYTFDNSYTVTTSGSNTIYNYKYINSVYVKGTKAVIRFYDIVDLQEVNVVMLNNPDYTFTQDYNLTYTTGTTSKYTGTVNLKYSGKIDSTTLNDTLTVQF